MRMSGIRAVIAIVSVIAPLIGAHAQSVVEQNSNVVGRTMPGYYRGIPAMQDNEASCAINPILQRNIVCAWNASGGSDDLIGDTWLRFSESLDGGRRFHNRYLRGSNLEPGSSIGQQFAADPVMMCWPGGCGTVMLSSTRAENGGQGGGIYMQWMVDLNTETGFRKAFRVSLDQVYRSTGSHFADKPHALYMLDETNPGTVSVTMEVEMPDGSFQTLTRDWPRARIVVVFALFNPSKNDIEILSTFTDDYGGSWSNPKQIAVTSGRDQGVSVAAIGDTIFYGFRRFANQGDSDDLMGVVSADRGQKIGKPFVIAEDVCVYDVPTLPRTDNSSLAAARTNDFPWVSQDGSKFVMVYSERRRSSDGGCLTRLDEPSDSRIMATVGSANGKNWSTPTEVAPNLEHGFQFMPVVDCSLGVCQVAWWDSRRDSERVHDYLTNQGTPAALSALDYFLNVPILADFHSPTTGTPEAPVFGYQFKRTADMFTRKIKLKNNGIEHLGDAVMASKYRMALYPTGDPNGELIERENNPYNVKAYKSNMVPFMSDYSSLTSLKHRYVFNPDDLTQAPYWESNAGPNSLNPTATPLFWLAWTDARNMRGQIYTYAIDGTPPYARTYVAPETVAGVPEPAERTTTNNEDDVSLAESVEDFNPSAPLCQPVVNPPRGGQFFYALQNRIKDSDIYGAMIENQATAWSLNPTKTLGLIQRTYVIVIEYESDGDGPADEGQIFRLQIANQPAGFDANPKIARASWEQLPFDPTSPEFQTQPPVEETLVAVGPRSSASIALFLVSDESVNPVTVDVYNVTDDPTGVGVLVNSVTVNGAIEAGPLLNPDGTVNNFELHNPKVYAPDFDDPTHYNVGHYSFDEFGNPDLFNPDQYNPDQFNPDQYNPDQFNPDLFNPDLFNPDQFNPDQFNPDQFNPDQYNPDQFNPDQFNPDLFNPDQFNPDQFNPDQFNPDQFNLTLTDGDDLHNPEIPDPDLSSVVRDPDGTVSRVDVNFGLQNVGNTLTPYTVDFAISDPEVLALITSGQIATQLIAWQNKQIDDVQFCEPRLVTENRVISAENNPDLSQLTIPTILDNRAGALTYFVAPTDIVQNTLRFIGPIDLITFVEGRLRNDIISYVFTAQTANTGETELMDDREQIINDRTPPLFNFLTGESAVLEANAPGGAVLPLDYVTAVKNGEPVAVSCAPALGSTVPLDILNGGSTTTLSCSAMAPNGVTATLERELSVVDTASPTIDFASVPADITREAESPSGTIVDFTLPTATDAFGVDAAVDVACTPAPGSLFGFTAPGPTQTGVTCIATDDSGNNSAPESFNVTIRDTSAPEFDDDIPFTPPAPPPPYDLDANESSFLLTWGPFDVTDADVAPLVECTPGTRDLSVQPPQYKFFHSFPPGSTTVTCTATDANGLSASLSFVVNVFDVTPPVITLNGDDPLTIDMGSGPYVDPGVTAIDNGDPNVPVEVDTDSSAVDTTTPGTYTVNYTATDPSGNQSTATRTVIVEFTYGMTGIIPAKTNVKMGSSNPLRWAWLDADGNPLDSSNDVQYLRIENCATGAVIIAPAGDPGASGFRFKVDNWWTFNWDSVAPAGAQYCAYVRSGLTGQEMVSPPIRVR